MLPEVPTAANCDDGDDSFAALFVLIPSIVSSSIVLVSRENSVVLDAIGSALAGGHPSGRQHSPASNLVLLLPLPLLR